MVSATSLLFDFCSTIGIALLDTINFYSLILSSHRFGGPCQKNSHGNNAMVSLSLPSTRRRNIIIYIIEIIIVVFFFFSLLLPSSSALHFSMATLPFYYYIEPKKLYHLLLQARFYFNNII